MSWGKSPNKLTNDIYCPYCANEGKKTKFACEIHDWAYHTWYMGLQTSFSQPSHDKEQRGFFSKPRDRRT